jgi:large subunit ribosomal protein L19
VHDPAAQLEAEAAAQPEAVDAEGAVVDETVAEAVEAAGSGESSQPGETAADGEAGTAAAGEQA